MEPTPGSTADVAACVDRRLWGKSADALGRPYPLICHLLDTAAVSGALFDALLSPERVAWLAGQLRVDPVASRDLVMFWAGLHDIGKISVPFQQLREKLCGSLWDDPAYDTRHQSEGDKSFRHDQATQVVLADVLPQLGYSGTIDGSGHVMAQLLGRHHGRVHSGFDEAELPRLNQRYATPLGQGEWQRQRLAHVKTLRSLIGPGTQAVMPERPSSAAVAVVLGLVVCADWLASQESFIGAGDRLPALDWQATDQNLRDHWNASVQDSASLVRAAGLGRARFKSAPRDRQEFAARFQFEPNQLQASLLTGLPDLVTGPGLVLITAPPGDGKTEASQLAVLHFDKVADAGGFAYVLPTMATTDAMFRRAREFADKHLAGQAALGLLHGMAWLNSDFETLAQSAAEGAAGENGAEILTDDAADRVFATDWLRASRRGILAPLGAMTIDQVLTGVLPVKHNLLRLFGLQGRTVVIDEAHSYGPWMHRLLIRLLEWLGAMRVPVVLMSATLTGRTAQDLVNAYRRGILGRRARNVEVQAPYPGWLFVDGVSGQVSMPQPVGTARPSRLHIEMLKVTANPSTSEASSSPRLAAILRVLEPLPVDGGCALVCCNTVVEAQQTYDFIVEALADSADDVRIDLLHSRFQAGDRGRITKQVEALYGKPDPERKSALRPRAAVLIATQVVEQSIDLDFDIVISDLAPLALLLQRAGRGRRHHRPARPAWTDPGCADNHDNEGASFSGVVPCSRLVVLAPVGNDGNFEQPKHWGSVYFTNLLIRTARLLDRLPGEMIAVPKDVQHLVDDVYTEDFVDKYEAASEDELRELHEADRKYLATVMAESQLAVNVAIHSPKPRAGDLAAELGGQLLAPGMEEFVVTRLGADSARALLVFDQGGDVYTLDPAGEERLSGRVDADGLRRLMEHVVPVPGSWLNGRLAVVEPPPAWSKNPVLSSLIIVVGRRAGANGWRSSSLPRLTYAPERGLSRT